MLAVGVIIVIGVIGVIIVIGVIGVIGAGQTHEYKVVKCRI